MNDLSGKVMMVTGAVSGIGAASARAPLAAGAKVALCDRDEACLQASVAALGPDTFALPAEEIAVASPIRPRDVIVRDLVILPRSRDI